MWAAAARGDALDVDAGWPTGITKARKIAPDINEEATGGRDYGIRPRGSEQGFRGRNRREKGRHPRDGRAIHSPFFQLRMS
jgi:hypothetical protein